MHLPHLGQSSIRIGRASFSRGEEVGGQILYQEPNGRFLRRKYGHGFAAIAVAGTIAAAAGLVELLSTTLSGRAAVTWLSVAAAIGAIGVFLLIGGEWGTPVTPIRVYAEGISVGIGQVPFISFSELRGVEEKLSYKGRVPFIALTFSDASVMSMGRGSFRSGNLQLGTCYPRVRSILFRKFPPPIRRGFPWAPEAEAFVETLPYIKGPVIVIAEALASKRGEAIIDMAFFSRHWEEIAGAVPALGLNTFRAIAFNEFRGPDVPPMMPLAR